MKRDLKRVYRHYGIKYFAFPIVVVLLLATLIDQQLDPYLDHREKVAVLEAQLENNRETLAMDSKIKRNHEELGPQYATVAPKLFVAGDITQSVNAMQEHLRQLLQSLYFDHVEFSDFTDRSKGDVTEISMNARFFGVPQQLPRLQAAVAQSSTIISIDALEVRVVEDPQRGGQQLAVTARFTGLHSKPLPELSPAPASK